MTHLSTSAVFFFLPLWLALAGCDPLPVKPGFDYRVTLLSKSPVTINQQFAPVSLDFAVTGCSQFEVYISQQTTLGERRTLVTHTQKERGIYTSKIPMVRLVNDQNCARDAQHPQQNEVRLHIKCLVDDRVALSEPLAILWTPAWRHLRPGFGDVTTVFGGQNELLTLSGGNLSWYEQATEIDRIQLGATEPDPLLLRDGNRGYLWVGCPLPSCTQVATDGGLAVARSVSYIYELRFEQEVLTLLQGARFPPRLPLEVAGEFQGMQTDDDGDLLVLTQNNETASIYQFDGGEPGSQIELPLRAKTGLIKTDSGEVLFLGLTPQEQLVASSHSGAVQWQVSLPGTGPLAMVSLANDGEHYALIRGGWLWLGYRQQWVHKVETDLARFSAVHDLGLVWSRTTLSMWNSNGVESFRLNPSAPLVFSYSLGDTPTDQAAALNHVVALRDYYLLTTSKGVRVLNSSGVAMGGLDPFPCAPGRTSQAVAVGHHLAAIAFGHSVYLLDISTMQE